MKPNTVQCDRCNKLVEGEVSIDGTTVGYYDVSNGFWAQFARWDELILCDNCILNDPKYPNYCLTASIE